MNKIDHNQVAELKNKYYVMQKFLNHHTKK